MRAGRAGGVQGRGGRSREDRGGEQPRDVVAPLDVDPPRAEVEAAQPRLPYLSPAARRDSSSTTLFWG